MRVFSVQKDFTDRQTFGSDVAGSFEADCAGVAVVGHGVRWQRRHVQSQAAIPARIIHPSIHVQKVLVMVLIETAVGTYVPREGDDAGERRREVCGGREPGDGQQRLGRQDVLQPVAPPRPGHVHREPPD